MFSVVELRCTRRHQVGVILVFSLLFLLLLASLTAALAGGGLMQLRLATNSEEMAVSRQLALGELELWLDYMGGAYPDGSAGERHCVLGSEIPDCHSHELPMGLASLDSSYITVVEEAGRPLPRLSERQATSALAYRAARYEITTEVEGRARGSGELSLSQGVLAIFPGEGS